MAEGYHALPNVAKVEDAHALTIPRALALLNAIKRHRDYSLIQLLRYPAEGAISSECIIVEVECDGVPPKSRVGIRYRERLALCVPNDPKNLIEVLALRRDFPILMHQNQGVPGAPASLCLYFEPFPAVMRTWTPATFLRRIQWWLEKSARRELHAADQPVEQLFFVSRYELVLPWDFAEQSKDPKRSFRIVFRVKRPDDRGTFFLESAAAIGEAGDLRAECIEFNMPPVVQDAVEPNPATLGQLHDQLSERGLDLLTPLKEAILKRVGDKGIPASSDVSYTIFLLHVPVCRHAGAPPEKTQHRAFLVNAGPLKTGDEIGVLFLHDKRYFNATGLLKSDAKTEWRSKEVMSVEILRENDRAAARRQSGVQDEGPLAVLIGAGSLGSAMLNLWGRSGWGHWTVIDKDHVKPHNLSRHIAFTQHIGHPKASVAASLHGAAMSDGEVAGVFGDACDLTNDEILTPLKEAALIVDGSTTLEYPRQVSTRDDLPRHVSVFITPNGNSAVLLAEDGERSMRLRTLEAQYYRAVIQNDWGKQHLVGNLATFWSGASCRDISTVLPYSRIMTHAATLAEQIPLASAQATAAIRIWERDPESAGVTVHTVEALPERRMKFGDLDLFMDDGVQRQLRALRDASLPNETGGVLLGYYDFNIRAVVVVCGLPAPPDSKSSPSMFERGTSGLVEAVNDATERTAGVVGYIGEWHSHPPNHSAAPSGHDIIQLCHLAFGMADDGLPALQLIVGEHDVQAIAGLVS